MKHKNYKGYKILSWIEYGPNGRQTWYNVPAPIGAIARSITEACHHIDVYEQKKTKEKR